MNWLDPLVGDRRGVCLWGKFLQQISLVRPAQVVTKCSQEDLEKTRLLLGAQLIELVLSGGSDALRRQAKGDARVPSQVVAAVAFGNVVQEPGLGRIGSQHACCRIRYHVEKRWRFRAST